jgi:hypothetical protein
LRAAFALAAHYRSMADKALAEKDHARWLKGAGDLVDEAAAWTGQSPQVRRPRRGTRCMQVKRRFVLAPIGSYDEAKRGVGYLGERIQ